MPIYAASCFHRKYRLGRNATMGVLPIAGVGCKNVVDRETAV
jgi:hypothetical protein